jgi:outer membrane protein assembly factor BamD (BamD/ComL family)
MKKLCLIAIVGLALTAFAPLVARAQGGVKQGPDVTRDPEMEKDSLHSLEAARLYFKLRKAYVASLQRCEEIIAGNPAFSRIDEVLYIAGKSTLYLSEGKGKQKPSLYKRTGANLQSANLTPEEFRSEARDYLSHLVNEYPDSKFREEALADLTSLGGPKPKESKQ